MSARSRPAPVRGPRARGIDPLEGQPVAGEVLDVAGRRVERGRVAVDLEHAVGGPVVGDAGLRGDLLERAQRIAAPARDWRGCSRGSARACTGGRIPRPSARSAAACPSARGAARSPCPSSRGSCAACPAATRARPRWRGSRRRCPSSFPAPGRAGARSTVTSRPDFARYQAEATPTAPAPRTATDAPSLPRHHVTRATP